MGPYKRTPNSVARAIRYSGFFGVRSGTVRPLEISWIAGWFSGPSNVLQKKSTHLGSSSAYAAISAAAVAQGEGGFPMAADGWG